MKKKTKRILFSAVAGLALIGTGLGFGLGFGLKTSDGITNTDTSSFSSVGELWIDHWKGFNRNNVNSLSYLLTGDKNATIDDVLEMASNTTTSEGIRTKNKGKDVIVRLGGLDWQVVYLSEDTSGNAIATLWLSSNEQDAFHGRSQKEGAYYGYYNGGLYSDWAADQYNSYYSVSHSSGIYGSSYIHVVTLNNGGIYNKISGTSSTASSSLYSYSKSSNSIFAPFTISTDGALNDLTDFLVTPQYIPWQANQNSVNNNINVQVTLPNESTTVVSDPVWKTNGSYGSASSLVNNLYYYSWKDDYLWLPSVSEVGRYGTYKGIWETSKTQKQNYDGETSDSDIGTMIGSSNSNGGTKLYYQTWLRSGTAEFADAAYTLYSHGGDSTSILSYRTASVRPALHLNLKMVSENIVDTNDIDLVEISTDMTKWTEYYGADAMNISHDSETRVNTITVSGADGIWEKVGYSFSVSAHKQYRISFKYDLSNFTPGEENKGINGFVFGVANSVGNDNGKGEYYIVLHPGTSGTAELYFTGSNSTSMIAFFNFGYIKDKTLATLKFWNFNNRWEYVADTNWEGSGTEEDPYQISSAEELAGIGYLTKGVGVAVKNLYFKQTKHINLAGKEWSPIRFVGENAIFDGGGYTINGLYINNWNNTDYAYQGLFGYVWGATLKNIRLTNSVIYSEGSYIGGIAGHVDAGFVKNCYSDCRVVFTGRTAVSHSLAIGGALGGIGSSELDSTVVVDTLTSVGNVESDRAQIITDGGVGGVIGVSSNSTIINASFKGAISSKEYRTGGVVGRAYISTISNCISSGFIRSTVASVGGLVGELDDDGTIEKCIVENLSMDTHVWNSALLCGKIYQGEFTIKNCSVKGSIDGNVNLGAVIGSIEGDAVASVSNCSIYAVSVDDIGMCYGKISSGSVTINNSYFWVNNSKKYYGSDFSGFAVVQSMNAGLPMLRELYAIASASPSTSADVINYLTNLGFVQA